MRSVHGGPDHSHLFKFEFIGDALDSLLELGADPVGHRGIGNGGQALFQQIRNRNQLERHAGFRIDVEAVRLDDVLTVNELRAVSEQAVGIFGQRHFELNQVTVIRQVADLGNRLVGEAVDQEGPDEVLILQAADHVGQTGVFRLNRGTDLIRRGAEGAAFKQLSEGGVDESVRRGIQRLHVGRQFRQSGELAG